MKITRYILGLVIPAFISCSGFLDEIDQDKFIPSTVDHYASLMLNEFNARTAVMFNTVLMTDEVAEISKVDNSEYRYTLKPLYTWQRDIELTAEGESVGNNTAWVDFYRQIAVANYVLEQANTATGSKEEIDYIIGEAYFIRAYCYFSLVNLYAEPYESEEQARITQGIPLRLDIGVNPTYNRKTISDNYKTIEEDLRGAKDLFEKSGLKKSLFHPGSIACELLMARVQLFQKKYKEAIASASEVIAVTPLQKMTVANKTNPFYASTNPELIYVYGLSGKGIGMSDILGAQVDPSAQLLSSYKDSDLRREVYFEEETNSVGAIQIKPRKRTNTISNMEFYCYFRSAEAYLIRAEGYAHTNQEGLAKKDMEDLLKKRYQIEADVQVPQNTSELIAFIWQERKKELCFEEHYRWFDLRRMNENERPEIVHTFTITDAGGKIQGRETYRLLRNDRNYTLSLPEDEKMNNPLIYDYERFDKMAD